MTAKSGRPCLADSSLSRVVEALCAVELGTRHPRAKRLGRHMLPSGERLIRIVEELRAVLFPGYFSDIELSDESMPYYVGMTLDRAAYSLQEQVLRGLWFASEDERDECRACESKAAEITQAFIERLPDVRRLLASDVQAAYDGDPAAKSPDEAILAYPGLVAVTNYRIAHELYVLGVPLIPRIITEHAHGITGIDIHPGARIGPSFFIDHGTGVVIGETCIIGERVRLYQGVTLGAKSFPHDEHGRPIKNIERHPIIEDDVIIYAGATLLGRITVGRGAVIGGNVWLTESVPAAGRVHQARVQQEVFESGGGI